LSEGDAAADESRVFSLHKFPLLSKSLYFEKNIPVPEPGVAPGAVYRALFIVRNKAATAQRIRLSAPASRAFQVPRESCSGQVANCCARKRELLKNLTHGNQRLCPRK
jgi:hypothetical protein